MTELQRAALAFLNKWGPHCGTCCRFVNGEIVTPRWACVCNDESKVLRDALGEWPDPGPCRYLCALGKCRLDYAHFGEHKCGDGHWDTDTQVVTP